MDYTISEEFSLPSKGLIYSDIKNVNGKIRSMTTNDEMKRLVKSDRPFKVISDLIDSCILDDTGISSYDMCLGDYQYLLHRMRVATYGPMYKMTNVCPICGEISTQVVDLTKLSIQELDEDSVDEYNKLFELKLPKTGSTITLKYQTPRMVDDIEIRNKEIQKKKKDSQTDDALVCTLSNLVNTIDGNSFDRVRLETWARSLPMMDTNAILRRADKINKGIGLDNIVTIKCSNQKCGVEYPTTFRQTSEFFGPTLDE